jgi:hypothetical protein|tara:strand:- start:827 stop:976 length:150 start_codon:yes stop_codon:yes gene_type:complete
MAAKSDKEAIFGTLLAMFGLNAMGAPEEAVVGLPTFAAGLFLIYRGIMK